jgi:predicted nucleic acid-binding protein
MKAIADTGFIVAFANARDLHHRWAMQVAARLTGPALTCEAVLAEAAFHLHSVDFVLDLVRMQFLRPQFNLADHLPQLHDLGKRYADRRPDLADLCIVRMSELYPEHIVITVDEGDFRVYRRNKRDVLPLLCPPRQTR